MHWHGLKLPVVVGSFVLALSFAVAASARVGPDPSLGVAAWPAPPASYAVPKRAITVANAAGLRRALAQHRSRDIVLRDGSYESAVPFDNANGNRLYAQHRGKAVLKAGIVLGGNSGPGGGLVRGIAFDVDTNTNTLQGSIIHVWGTGRNSRILDVTLEGHMTVNAGIIARQVEGLVIRRVNAQHFRSWGVMVDRNQLDATVNTPPRVEDVSVAHVTRTVPRSSNGTAEACVWIGNTATVRRVDAHDCAWEGLWAGTAARVSLFEYISSHDNEIGVYFEHYNSDSTIRRLQAGPNVRIGVMCEWADPAWGYIPGCINIVVEQSYFDTRLAGVILDEGTRRTTVRTSTFVNQCWAGIGDYRGVGNLWDTVGNDFSGLKPQATPISGDHYFTGTCA